MCAGEDVLGREGGVVHVAPFDFLGMVGEKVIVLGFAVAVRPVPGVGEHVEVAAERFCFSGSGAAVLDFILGNRLGDEESVGVGDNEA